MSEPETTYALKASGSARPVSPLTLKIMGVNIAALFMLAFGFLYTAQYENQLIETELNALSQEAKLIAAAISEGGVRIAYEDNQRLARDLTQLMVRKLSTETDFRIILFDASGNLLADSQRLSGAGGIVEVTELAPPKNMQPLLQRIENDLTSGLDTLPVRVNLEPFPDFDVESIQSVPDMIDTLKGESFRQAWNSQNGDVLLSVTRPIARLKQVLGGLMLIRTGDRIEQAVNTVQFNVILVFLATLAITILLSLYLSTTIATPIRRLSTAAQRMRDLHQSHTEIPDLSNRRDEIGDLSISLRELTENLQRRLKAIESFAADVAHELKNPLASVRSAVETLPRAPDAESRAMLEKIIFDDLRRLDRLISDISSASRLDSELNFDNKSLVDLRPLLSSLTRSYNLRAENGTHFTLNDKIPDQKPATVWGHDGRLTQIISNVLDNALTFADRGTTVRIILSSSADILSVAIENKGPCIAENKLEAIFNRFYSERPKDHGGETHSGLGLSISRQIAHAHGGDIRAENILDDGNLTTGVRFIITLPFYSA